MRRFSRFNTDDSTYTTGWDVVKRWSNVSTLEEMSRYYTVYQSNYSPFTRTVFCSEASSSGLIFQCFDVNIIFDNIYRQNRITIKSKSPYSNGGILFHFWPYFFIFILMYFYLPLLDNGNILHSKSFFLYGAFLHLASNAYNIPTEVCISTRLLVTTLGQAP